MFRKKKDETVKPGQGAGGDARGDNGDADNISAPPLKPFTRKGTHVRSKPPTAASFHPDIPRRSPPEIPGISPRRAERSLTGSRDSRRLMIGRDIILSGEITSCDRLIVEGRAEVTIEGADMIEVAPSGFFKGSADVEEADISGRFEGQLIARDQLIVRASGRISGTIRYGRIVIEAGGEVSGDMRALESGGADDEVDGGVNGEAGEDGAPDDIVIETPKRKRNPSKPSAEKK